MRVFIREIGKSVPEVSHKRIEVPDRSVYFNHIHNRCEFLLFVSGEAEYNIDGKVYTPSPWDLILIPSGVYHYLIPLSSTPYENYVIGVAPYLIAQAHYKKIFTPPYIINIKDDPELPGFFSRLDIFDSTYSDDDFTKCLHAKKDVNPDERYIVHFPQDNTIMSVNSAYGGNVLLGKKCFALRIASYLGKQEGWMAEHMLILGLENPKGEVKYIAAAFPSACGKTNLAMLIPPEYLKEKGYKVWTIGDDIAWLRIGEDGRLYAINPEAGFFGVAPGTSEKTNFNALESTKKNTIFTNVAINNDMTVWWEGLDKNPPENCTEWTGQQVNGKTFDGNLANPNSRFTAPAINCPCISKEFENPQGVPISAIVFGGRRAKTAPLVYQARDWEHGVFVGATMASETTAAATGAVGVVRRDPMAMKPFVGYNMADYFGHWIEMGKKMDADKAPKIFHVNWFRKDEDGNFLWPGFGDNMRVLLWILDRCAGNADAVESEIGLLPTEGAIDTTDLDITAEQLKELLSVDKAVWMEDVENQEEYFAQFGDKLPAEIKKQLEILKNNLK